MIFAKINNEIVQNLLELRRTQAEEFPDCVDVGELPVAIGDIYRDGKFYRDGKEVKTALQHAHEYTKRIAEAALVVSQEVSIKDNTAPATNVGLFAIGADEWEPNKPYSRFDLFRYGNAVGWVKQAHTSTETWIPFSVGTEALYGARPEPDEDGIYPYVYNMKVEPGMKVRHDGVLYECIQGTDGLLFEPGQVPAMFKTLE